MLLLNLHHSDQEEASHVQLAKGYFPGGGGGLRPTFW